MRHRPTVLPALIFLGLGLCGSTQPARGDEPTDDRLGRRTAPIFLLTRSDVQAALKLDSKQIALCQRAAFALQRLASNLKGRKDAGANAARRQIDEEMSLWLSKYLTPLQLGRLDQIDLQWEGAAAMLTRPFYDEGLKLTDDQTKKIRGWIVAGDAQRTRGAWSYEDHVNETRKAIAVLDERQYHFWTQVLGPPCPFKIAVKAQTARNDRPAQGSSSPRPR